MAGYIPPQLVALIGDDLHSVTETHLRRLIGIAESQSLDAKRDPYGNSDGSKRDLAVDVAAFANRQGGLIAVGLDEDVTGIVSDITPHSDAVMGGEELRMTQIICSQVAPVPGFDFRRVPAGDGSVLLLSIPPSVRRPHAVIFNNETTMRFPIREGAHNRYLAESELADLYRSRFADARAQADEAEQRHEAVAKKLGYNGWLVASIQPDRPGSFTATRTSIEPLATFGMVEPIAFPAWHGPTRMYVSPSFRSLRVTDLEEGVYARMADLRLDGGGTVACHWDRDESLGFAQIADEDILADLVNALWSLASWATNSCGTSGDATLLAELYAAGDCPVVLYQYRTMFGPERIRGGRELREPTGLVETTVSLDGLLRNRRDLLATARRVTGELESAFGVLGPPQVTVDGSLRKPYFSRGKVDQLERWAEHAGIEVTDETIDS